MIGLCFKGVASDELTVQQAVPYSDGMTKAMLSANADNLQVMGDDGQYTNYFLSNGQYGKASNPSYNAELDGKWLKTAGTACTDTIKVGQAFWYVSKAASTTPHSITVAGAVLTSTDDPKTIKETYNLYANPYACDVPLNGNLIVTGGTKAMLSANADVLQVMGADGQYTNYFLSNGQYGKASNPSYNAELDGKWLKTAGTACNDSLPAGASFWYVSQSQAGTVQLVNPLAE